MSDQPEVVAPTKVCPHCGAQTQTLAKKCPNCGKSYKKRTILKIFIGLCLAGLVFVIGCAALVGTAVNDAVNNLNAEQEKSAITRAQFKQLHLGMTEKQVKKQLGKKPQDRQDLQSEGVLDGEPSNSACIYYNKADGEWLDTYQLCFDNGRLTSKNDW